MSNGVEILDTITKNCFVKQLGPKKFKIILTQGLNRQIRRMCESLGYRVLSLKRVRIMNIKLDMPTGKYREFTKEELTKLNRLLIKSSKTYD
jgi:pseudouridine synthase